jgi:hypothetical protein
MLQYLDPVPFTVENEAHLGLTETQGLLSCDGRHLVIEHRTADTVFGLVKSSSREIAIPLGNIRSIRFAKKFMGFGCAITLQTVDQKSLEAFADSMHGRIELKVKRTDRAIAEDFCLEVAQAVIRLRNEKIAGELEE